MQSQFPVISGTGERSFSAMKRIKKKKTGIDLNSVWKALVLKGTDSWNGFVFKERIHLFNKEQKNGTKFLFFKRENN